ncbi:cupin domain-containing protein [Demequina muriae]|uniref:Cupin domain-containing protein n=1 Tax=Demequina muriae TaxID=3051664 RepID=A0ABT8GF58_9MICO|nr:cupin domain-containing protein [Demequina sp. EGI L300058]MDN4480063.1 cupin domain-containing protein [Demequina sp. EGI L300058]
MTTPATAQTLGLEPHPEGGWFRRTWTSDVAVETPGGVRPAATCIHYLLTPGERSAWHVVSSDEIWLWHGPGALELRLGGSGDAPADRDQTVAVRLGPDRDAGDAAQCVVPAGVWQSATLVTDREALVSCVVSPGFDFADWRLAHGRE